MTLAPHRDDFETAEEFLLLFLDDDRFRSPHIYGAFDSDYGGGYLFRGQAGSQWPLLPSAFRPGDPLRRFTPQPPSICNAEQNRRRYLGMHLHAELRAVMIFLENADRVGLKTPVDYRMMSAHVELISDALSGRDADFNSPFPKPELFASVALAQHHGVPTRFLDWTESPLIAAFFAAYPLCFGERDFDSFEDGERFLSVFYFYPGHLDSNKIPLQTVLAPRANNSFLLAQKGVFTNFTKANSYFLENGEWPSIEYALSSSVRPQTLYQARLPHSEAAALLKRLYDLGVRKQTVAPSLANCAESYAYTKTLFE